MRLIHSSHSTVKLLVVEGGIQQSGLELLGRARIDHLSDSPNLKANHILLVPRPKQEVPEHWSR